MELRIRFTALPFAATILFLCFGFAQAKAGPELAPVPTAKPTDPAAAPPEPPKTEAALMDNDKSEGTGHQKELMRRRAKDKEFLEAEAEVEEAGGSGGCKDSGKEVNLGGDHGKMKCSDIKSAKQKESDGKDAGKPLCDKAAKGGRRRDVAGLLVDNCAKSCGLCEFVSGAGGSGSGSGSKKKKDGDKKKKSKDGDKKKKGSKDGDKKKKRKSKDGDKKKKKSDSSDLLEIFEDKEQSEGTGQKRDASNMSEIVEDKGESESLRLVRRNRQKLHTLAPGVSADGLVHS